MAVIKQEVQDWDSEMDELVKWFDSYPWPEKPFTIGEALQVVGDAFLTDIKRSIDLCEYQKEHISYLREKLKRYKAWMSEHY
ncbi:MAG: hypothetical protein HQL32_01235 [Planctomycetes bacterium]|nr:hypothetical protein [Planctomycetota bacterium]